MKEETISSRDIFEGRILKLRVDTVRTADGRESTREVIEHAPCIAVIAIDENDHLLLERQYRQALRKTILEIPAGGIDPGETPEQAVVREMREETGFKPQKVERIGGFYSTPGFSDEYLHLFLATDLVPSRLHSEDTAAIEVVRLPVSEIPAIVSSGQIEDSKTVAGLLLYHEYRNRQ